MSEHMEASETIEPTPVPAKHKRLTEAEWAEAKALYEMGKMTKTDLGAHYGITKQSMGEGLNARGAVYGSKSSVIEAATIEAQKDNAQRKVEEIEGFKDKQKKMVEMVQNLSVKAVTDKVRAGKPISDAKNDIVTLRAVMATLRMGRDELYHLHDLHRDPDAGEALEEFIVSEYSHDEIAALNQERLGITADTDADLAAVEASLQDDDTDDISKLLGE